MSEEDTRYERALRQLESVRRSGRFNMYSKNKIVLLAEECDLHALVSVAYEILDDDRHSKADNWISLLEDMSEQTYNEIEKEQIETWAEVCRNTEVQVSI